MPTSGSCEPRDDILGFRDASLREIVVPRKIAISGSREYPHPNFVTFIVHGIKASGAHLLVGFNPKDRTPRGVDMVVWDAAAHLGAPITPYPAKWLVNGRKNMNAGLLRNIEMIDAADDVICFWDGSSRGTAHAIVYAHQHGKLFRIYGVKGGMEDPEQLLIHAYAVRKVPYVPAPLPDTMTPSPVDG